MIGGFIIIIYLPYTYKKSRVPLFFLCTSRFFSYGTEIKVSGLYMKKRPFDRKIRGILFSYKNPLLHTAQRIRFFFYASQIKIVERVF